MKIQLVNYEKPLGYNGILTKYAEKMCESLKALGHDAVVTEKPEEGFDITHHINCYPYIKADGINTVMVTHFMGDESKVKRLEKIMETADAGISMDNAQVEFLENRGFKNQYRVLPAHDSLPRRHTVIAICSNIYPSGCKREGMFLDLVKTLDKDKFAFRIMGKDWHDLLEPLVREGLQVDYFSEFNPEYYKMILDSSDYMFYPGGEDCIPQSILDATQAGLRTICGKQEWQKELPVNISFTTQESLNDVFIELAKNPVEYWTWENYCRKHIDIWNEIKSRK